MSLQSELAKYAAFMAPRFENQNGTCEVFMVSPRLPTVAGDTKCYSLVGSDICELCITYNLHVIPELIDVPRFNEALASTLSSFPTFAGRIRRNVKSGEWWIELGGSPVPVTVDGNSTAPLLDDWVVDPMNLGSFLEPINFVDLINKDEPVLSIKLSLLPESNTTVLGIIVSHQVSDAFHTLEFSKMLSDYYEGITPSSLPSFVNPELLPMPPMSEEESQAIAEAMGTDLRFKNAFVPIGDAYSWLERGHAHSSPVKLRFSASQLEKLKDISNDRDYKGPELSRLDSLSSYLISTINRFISEPVSHIHIVWNSRSATDPSHYGGNGVAVASTEVLSPEAQKDKRAIALAIRRSLIIARDPEVFKIQGPLSQVAFSESAKKGNVLNIMPTPGRAMINSNTRYDWSTVHFGNPGRTRFHTAHFGDCDIRVFRSNPHIVDGKVVDAREGSWDVFFRVNNDTVKQVAETIERDLLSLDESGCLISV